MYFKNGIWSFLNLCSLLLQPGLFVEPKRGYVTRNSKRNYLAVLRWLSRFWLISCPGHFGLWENLKGLTDICYGCKKGNWSCFSFPSRVRVTGVFTIYTFFNMFFLWLWRWLPHRLSKRQSLSTTTVLFRTTFARMIKLNLLLKCFTVFVRQEKGNNLCQELQLIILTAICTKIPFFGAPYSFLKIDLEILK